MFGLINTIVNIGLLRTGPQALPRSVSWTLLSLLAYVGGYTWQVSAAGSRHDTGATAILDAALTVAVCAVLLYWRGYPGRLLQTLLAFFGTGCLLLLVSTPLVLALGEPDAEPTMSFPVAGLLVILFWSLAIAAHIYRHALDISFSMGLLTAVVYFVVWFQLQAMLLPVAA